MHDHIKQDYEDVYIQYYVILFDCMCFMHKHSNLSHKLPEEIILNNIMSNNYSFVTETYFSIDKKSLFNSSICFISRTADTFPVPKFYRPKNSN
jgi:hypothetical protein